MFIQKGFIFISFHSDFFLLKLNKYDLLLWMPCFSKSEAVIQISVGPLCHQKAAVSLNTRSNSLSIHMARKKKKKSSSLKSSTQKQTEERKKKKFLGILNYTAAASCILHLHRGREAQLSPEDGAWHRATRTSLRFCFFFSSPPISVFFLFLLIKNALAKLMFAVEFICIFSARQVRNCLNFKSALNQAAYLFDCDLIWFDTSACR